MLRHLRKILTVFLLLALSDASATVYYVMRDTSVPNSWSTDGSKNVTVLTGQDSGALAAVFDKATAGDEIWMQGFDKTGAGKEYAVPQTGITVKSGVRVYGGFMGNETSIDQRTFVGNKQYRFRYRTLITGDTGGDDNISDANFIFPEGEPANNRADNASHVLMLDMTPTQASGNSNGYSTIVNGLTIARGHANGTNACGGGIYITGDNTNGGAFRIEQCFFIANYASRGGAVYVDKNVAHRADDNRIDRCAFFNNAAGVRTLPSNSGAAIYAAGGVNIVNSVVFNNANGGINGTEANDVGVYNSTITRNSVAGIDGADVNVYNTAVWGNTSLYSTEAPRFYHCAYTGADTGGGDGNIHLNDKNNAVDGPVFVSPSLKIGYDLDFSTQDDMYPYWDWEMRGETVLVDNGSDASFASSFGNTDLNGKARIRGTAIDIGAYEFQPVDHIRYVKVGGTGDGSSWDNASGNLQRMIDDLADTGGEVWVAAGIYEPMNYLVSDKVYTASFLMRNNVSVYGGFAGGETSKSEREKGTMPWEFKNETILRGQGYAEPASWGSISSSSRHVVWFAPLTQDGGQEVAFTAKTSLDGVTVMGGYAPGGNGMDDFLTDRGAGIYMKGDNVSVTNCIVKNNYATGPGGGIYVDGGGRTMHTLVYNNVSNDNGGAIYVNGAGWVLGCMLTNNQSRKGAGAYLAADGLSGEIQMSTCVVSNNTSTHNGAVYCDNGGIVIHNTIVNNLCTKSTDTADRDAAQTGGLYVDGYTLLVNSVLWNNRFGSTAGTDIPVYVKNPSTEKVRFMYNAVSGTGNAVWNGTLQEETLFLQDGILGGNIFMTGNAAFDKVGVQEDRTAIDYFWAPAKGSILWSAGLEQGRFPQEVQIASDIDIMGEPFPNKPSIGAANTEELIPVCDVTTELDKMILYVDPDGVGTDDDGSSWDKPFRSLNKAIIYMAGLSAEAVNGRTLEVRVIDGDLWPRYTFVNEDPKSATIDLLKAQSGAQLVLVGGYHRNEDGTVVRDPLTYRSIMEGNRESKDISEGFYHVVTVEEGAKVKMDGFHIVNGYAAGQAFIQHGAGLLAYDGADVTLVNCIFEDNTAVSGAAVYAEGNAKVTMRNCVVNNNTNTDASSAEAVVYCQNGALVLEHVSFINNIGAAPASLGSSSFALNNTNGNSAFSMPTTGAKGAEHFANPANDVGAKLGFDTYLGGYAVYRPLTSSKEASDYIINKVSSGTSSDNRQDITAINDRDLGGVPDLGAYEAILPKKGRVYYVRMPENGGSDSNDGVSWDKAFATVRKAVETAAAGIVENGEKPQVWVAAGTYSQNPKSGSPNCFEILDGVNVYGAFPKTGSPGMNERHPLISTYVPYDNNYSPSDYETILQPLSTNTGSGVVRRVLGQADVYNPVSGTKGYYNNFVYSARWDGFTLQNGYLDSNSISNLTSDGPKRNGGAGVCFFNNTTVINCIIYNNENTSSNTGKELRGGAVYMDGGTLTNCYIIKNKFGRANQYTAYGGGLYLYNGIVYNCVISENESIGQHTDGAGCFAENGVFFNNTVVKNVSRGTTRGNGGLCAWRGTGSEGGIKTILYNSIFYDNVGYTPNGTALIGTKNISVNGGEMYCYNSVLETYADYKSGNKILKFENCQNGSQDMFKDYTKGDYRLNGSIGINMGENTPIINNNVYSLFEFTDMDFTDRIKDCTVDVGAYERNNQDNVSPDLTSETDKAIYYVTQNGAGTANGNSLENAACAMKLQEVLDAAGEYAEAHPDKNVIVKVAGYESGTFTYHVNKLANVNNPQSYSYSIPYSVTVMGGYNEKAPDWNDDNYSDNTYKDSDGKEQNKRDITQFRTIFSGIKQATSTTQEVQGYHTVTFKGIPADWKEGDRQTIIDGVYIQDGSATSLAGGDNDDTKGGAAIVPAGAHVRNCVIQNNEAKQGGGLYVLPGGWVSGCVIKRNSAEGDGGGIYADSNGSQHAYFVSNTIADNTASRGGGVYIENGAAMTLNSVIWRNTANCDKDVSAAVNVRERDEVLDAMLSNLPQQEWYPFNNCCVESIELPCNLQNAKMESSSNIYFANEDYALKYDSPLIDHGMVKAMQTYLAENKNVSTHDMQGLERVSLTDIRMDVGAFAFAGTMLDNTKLLTRIFVSHNSDYVLAETEAGKEYMGKTFYTPFTWLGDALEYIRTVRASSDEELAKKAKAAEFEIFVAAGTYTPKYQRSYDPSTHIDLRQNSFIVPYGVKIYGGFMGNENFSSNVEDGSPITSIDFVNGTINGIHPLEDDSDVNELLALRQGSDFNDNQVKDAWEMAGQTILSGSINLSNEEQNVYHVVYSAKDNSYDGEQKVLLDGVTIQDGYTLKEVGTTQDVPKGRGGGIYSNGVHYTLVNSRLLNNKAVRGGAAFIQNADLTLVNSMVAGNETWKENINTTVEKDASGGGVFVISTDGGKTSLKAVNTLWANNESVEYGGAIGVEGNSGVTIDLMNNTFVMNKAEYDAVLYHTEGTTGNVRVVNTVMWGNESKEDRVKDVTVKYSASDHDYSLEGGKSLFGPDNGLNNIFLSKDNLALDGPRFEEPSTVAGFAGYNLNNKWNPIAVSPLTDHGSGMMNPAGTDYEGDEQAYKEWFKDHANDYIGKYMLSEEYQRYSGPNREDGTPDNKPIDIGVYEYQYVTNFSTMDKIYVATVSSGEGTGMNWQNATDDLRGALIGAANPTSGGATRNVYVRGGDYPWPVSTSGNSVFPVHIGGNTIEWRNLNIIGSCTGVGDEQDFSKPTVILRHPYVPASSCLMEISSSHSKAKPVMISGLTFSNCDIYNNINYNCSGVKVTGNNSDLTMKHVAFRNNPNNGLEISSNSGNVLLVNALFADNGNTGLTVGNNLDKTILVNTTFANNGKDMTEGVTEVYNSTSWNNSTQNMPAAEENNNKVFAANTANDGIEQGPNFHDPDNADKSLRDYRIRPSLTLLNTGSNGLYLEHALNGAAAMPEDERDLYNVSRVVGGTIDIGAYEYRAPLQQIIYVKEGIVKDNDGKSWETALTDLQNAANLAGIYAKQMGIPAYVFVHNNVNQGLNIQLDKVKVYGGMNDEVTQKSDNKDIVADLLSQRAGLLERTSHSQLTGALTIAGENSVVDGFEVKVAPVINKGVLSTSMVAADVSGTDGGILYNSLVKGNVSGVKTINVTATGTIGEVEGNGNNRTGAAGDNKYVTTDDWNYQLMETSADIDAGTTGIDDCIEMVGHDRDVAGNKRIRNTVDNGCFETWNITKDMTSGNVVTEDDYPHGKSVVYVRHTDGGGNDETVSDGGAELLITKNYTDAAPFNPGFLLLEHHAGLRANGRAVGMTHFAVERNIGASGADMAVMPFEVTRTEGTAALSLYDAVARAGYGYQYSGTDGAWTGTSYNAYRTPITTGWLLEGTAGSKMRFYGDSYVENVDGGKSIELVKNNFSEPWNSRNGTGNRFTHKENMSWNLFGSPYLCAMNYGDMLYGRVMYGYRNGAYTTLNTIDGNAEGYIPAGDAVFTQTATLKERETFAVERPAEDNRKSGRAYQGSMDMAVALSSAYTRSGGDGQEDRLQLKAVPAEESRQDFDINGDGVKWMSAGRPQIYARQGGGRYSLLSAVNIEGEVSVGVSLPEAGMYTFAIPGDCSVDDYETVMLKDNETGRQVDLLEGDYDFSVVEAGDIKGRFTISFNRMRDDRAGNGLRIWCPARNMVRLQGTKSGDVITVYSVSGAAIASRIASSSVENISAQIQGVVIVEVKRAGNTIVRKIRE